MTIKKINKKSAQMFINKMVTRIITEFRPEKIILFGSHARGDAAPYSDIDLLIVMPVKGSKRKLQIQIQSALYDIRVSKDIIVSKPEEFEWRKDIVGTIEWPATHEDRVLYAKV